MRTTILSLLLASLLVANRAHSAEITWFSVVSDPAGSDAGFVDLLESAGHTVTRFTEVAPLSAENIAQLNSADLVIAGRAVNSGSFDNANGQIWNTQITVPVIAMSAYTTRNNRMGWQAGNNVPDSGPTPLVAADPSHPIFSGIAFQGDGVTMANDYNIMIDRGTSTIADALAGGTVIATNPSLPGGIAIAAWPAGTMVVDENIGSQTLVGDRYFFAGGSREADGMGVSTAGVLDLTDDGQLLFLNTVNYALGIPEPSTWVLSAIGFATLLVVRKR